MCRSDVVDRATEPIALLLTDMAIALGLEFGVDPSTIAIGPVDFGESQEEGTQ